MTRIQHPLELLAPAKNADFGIEAIKHGADAVYIGGPAFGARSAADNSVADIAAGMYAYTSILAALLQRGKTGQGGHIDVSMLESLAGTSISREMPDVLG